MILHGSAAVHNILSRKPANSAQSCGFAATLTIQTGFFGN